MTDRQHAQRSPEWFAARRNRLTASLAGAVLGVAPYMSRDDAMRSLVRDMHGLPSEFSGNIATEYGNDNEALARTAYEMETGHTTEDAGFVAYAEWGGASPDAYVIDAREHKTGLLEIKCPFGKRKDESPVFAPIADQPHYYAQVQVQLFCTGLGWCDFWQWSAHGHKLERVVYDGAWINENIPKLVEFWEAAKAADPADFEGPKRVVIDTPESECLITEYDELSDAIENANARKKDIIARMVEMTSGKNGMMSGRNLTLVQRQGSVSYAKALKELAPDADLEPYRGKPSESWQIR